MFFGGASFMACFASRYLWPFSESEWCVQCRPWLGKGVFGLKSRSKLVPNDWSGQIIIAISVTTRALNFGSWGLGKSHLFQGNLAWWNFLTWASLVQDVLVSTEHKSCSLKPTKPPDASNILWKQFSVETMRNQRQCCFMVMMGNKVC